MSDSPFSQSNIKKSIEEIDTPDKEGGEIEVRVAKEGAEVEGTVAVGEHVAAGGWFKSTWNGVMDYAGIVKFKW